MLRHIAANALSFIILAIAGIGVAILWGQRQFSEPGPLQTGMCLTVESGSNMKRVAQSLADQNAVTSKFIFSVGSSYAKKNSALKAGSFLIPAGASSEDILDIVTRGGANTCGNEVLARVGVRTDRLELRKLDVASGRYAKVSEARLESPSDAYPAEIQEEIDEGSTNFRIVIAEGVTSARVVDALIGLKFLSGEVAEVPAEGLLAPGSYEARKGTERSELLGQMAQKQTQIIDAAWANRDPDLPIKSKEEMLILASVIEGEAGQANGDGEWRKVASVFVNRLNKGMRLEADATVRYGITLGTRKLGRGLRRSELEKTTPYNTYKIDGLPLTPILNPGKAAIEATVTPDTTDYIFFVADGTGGHAFAETLSEHRANVVQWRKIEKQLKEEAERNSN